MSIIAQLVSSVSFSQMLTDLYTMTNRPDLVNESAIALRKATMKFHMADDWINDETQSIVVPVTLFTGDTRYSIDLSQSPFGPTLRKIKSLAEYVTPPNYGFVEFDRLEVNDLLDQYGYEKVNYFYRVGSSLNFRCDHVVNLAKVTWFQYPNIVQATYNSWIANVFPDCIVEEAAGTIFGMIGKPNEQKIQQGKFAENLQMLRQMAIISGG